MGLASGKPVAESYASDYGYSFNPAAANNQFHAQDAAGQYNYGYSNPLGAKQETKTADGVVRGSYSYIDANGLVQTVNYISDVFGFRSVSTNDPVSIGQQQALVKAVPVQKVIKAQEAQKTVVAAKPAVLAPTVAYTHLPYATQFGYFYNPNLANAHFNVAQLTAAAPVEQQVQQVIGQAEPETPAAVIEPQVVPVAQAPVIQPVPVVPAAAPVVTQSQYHAQDELGQYQFGYADPNSARTESKTADGVVTGTYNYVDDAGKIQTVHYIADAGGFRVIGTNLPVATYEAAVPIAEAPEVAAAREEHQQLFEEIKLRDEELRAAALVQVEVIPELVEVIAEPKAAPLEQLVQVKPAEVVAAAVAEPAPEVEVIAPVAAPVQVAPVQVEPVPVPAAVPVVTSSQFHAQDELGQYNYGYASPLSSKQESKTADGVVQGAYQYIDANGKLQSVQYVSDALGFRVAATNLPVHVVPGEEPAEPVAVVVNEEAAEVPVAVEVEAKAAQQPALIPQVSYSYLPYATQYSYLLPGTSPVVAASKPAAVTATAPVKPAALTYSYLPYAINHPYYFV